MSKGMRTSAALLVVATLLAAACSSTSDQNDDTAGGTETLETDAGGDDSLMPGDDGELSDSDTGTRTDAAELPSAGGAQRPTSDAAAEATGGADPHLPPFKLGFVNESSNALGQLGMAVDLPSDERVGNWIKALVAHINKTGGVGGRPLEVEIRFVDQSDQGESNQTRLQTEACIEMTEDLKMDMVMGTATDFGFACYATHKTPVFHPIVPRDNEFLRPLQPWVLPSYWVVLDRLNKLMPLGLAAQNFMTEKIGVISFDQPHYKRAVENILKPEVAKHGGKVIEVAYARVELNEVFATMQSAALRFKAAGVDRVIVMGYGGGLYLVFAQHAESQAYRPKYGLSSMDNAFLMTDLAAPGQRDIAGVGFFSTADIDSESMPPPSAGEKECWRILNEGAGENFQGREQNSSLAVPVCDMLFMLDRVLDQRTGSPLAGRDVPGLFRQLGDQYESLMLGRVDFTPPRYDSVTRYAHFVYEAGCDCTKYTTDWKRIPF